MIEMKNEDIENLLRNVLRFFVLLLITAGIMIGMGAHFLLNFIGSGFIPEAAFVAFVCVGILCASFIVKKSQTPTATARMATLSILVAGILAGVGASILLGVVGSQMLAILMFVVVIVWGLWVFRKKE